MRARRGCENAARLPVHGRDRTRRHAIYRPNVIGHRPTLTQALQALGLGTLEVDSPKSRSARLPFADDERRVRT